MDQHCNSDSQSHCRRCFSSAKQITHTSIGSSHESDSSQKPTSCREHQCLTVAEQMQQRFSRRRRALRRRRRERHALRCRHTAGLDNIRLIYILELELEWIANTTYTAYTTYIPTSNGYISCSYNSYKRNQYSYAASLDPWGKGSVQVTMPPCPLTQCHLTGQDRTKTVQFFS